MRKPNFFLSQVVSWLPVIVSTICVGFFFRALLSSLEMPGLDTPGHFAALEVLIAQLQHHQGWYGYTSLWFGGMPHLVLYGPSVFLVLAGLHFLLPFLSLMLLFRSSIWLGVILFPAVFTWCCEQWFSRKVRAFAPLFSLIYMFYPLHYSLRGFGVGAVIRGGLISNWFGILLLLGLCGVWRRHIQQRQWWSFILGTVLLAAVVTTHILVGLSAVFLCVAMLIAVRKNRDLLLSFIAQAAIAMVLSAWWWIPFLAYLPYSAGEMIGANVGTQTAILQMIPLIPLQVLGRVYILPSLSFVVAWGVAGIGLYRYRRVMLSPFFLAGVVILTSEICPVLFPNFTLHYYRFIPIVFVLGFILGAVALSDIFAKVKHPIRYLTWYVVCVGVVLISVIQWQTAFDGLTKQITEVEYVTTVPTTELSVNYASMVEQLKRFRPQRVLPIIDINTSMAGFGSAHYLTAKLPGDANTTVLTGLYAEAAALTPALMSTTFSISGGNTHSWGEQFLSKVSFFTHQPQKIQWQRIKHLGVDTVVLAAGDWKGLLGYSLASESATVKEVKPYTIYQLKKPAPFVESIPTAPIVFVNLSHDLRFQDVAQGLFLHPAAYRLPVIDGGTNLDYWLQRRDNISAVVIAAEGLGIEDVPMLAQFQKPIFLLDPPPDLSDVVKFDQLIKSAHQFVPAADLEKTNEGVTSWVWLGDQLIKLLSSGEAVAYEQPEQNVYSYTHTGWSFLRLGYAKDWVCESSSPCHVYRAAPGFIAVESNGQVTLRFRAMPIVRWLLWMAFGCLVMILISPLIHFLFWSRIKRYIHLKRTE